jgi:hypothetical protein
MASVKSRFTYLIADPAGGPETFGRSDPDHPKSELPYADAQTATTPDENSVILANLDAAREMVGGRITSQNAGQALEMAGELGGLSLNVTVRQQPPGANEVIPSQLQR